MARCLRPGGVLILCECGGKTRVLDEGVDEVWGLKYLMESLRAFADGNIYGEGLEDIIKANDLLELKAAKVDWVNANWVDPEAPNGKEVVDLMEKWIPVFGAKPLVTWH